MNIINNNTTTATIDPEDTASSDEIDFHNLEDNTVVSNLYRKTINYYNY